MRKLSNIEAGLKKKGLLIKKASKSLRILLEKLDLSKSLKVFIYNWKWNSTIYFPESYPQYVN